VLGYIRKIEHLDDRDLSGGISVQNSASHAPQDWLTITPTPRARLSIPSRSVSEHTGTDRHEVVNHTRRDLRVRANIRFAPRP
jgi:hypothetical protein